VQGMIENTAMRFHIASKIAEHLRSVGIEFQDSSTIKLIEQVLKFDGGMPEDEEKECYLITYAKDGHRGSGDRVQENMVIDFPPDQWLENVLWNYPGREYVLINSMEISRKRFEALKEPLRSESMG